MLYMSNSGYSVQIFGLHRLCQTFLVHWHLYRNVWKIVIDQLVRTRRYSRIVLRILVVLSNGSDSTDTGSS
jgi:hypothetical protein